MTAPLPAGGRPSKRIRVRVEGLVQGVGFRPFVCTLAETCELAGFVGNDADGVFIEAEGDPLMLDAFVSGLRRHAPPLSVVERIAVEPAEPQGEAGFRITPSDPGPDPDSALDSGSGPDLGSRSDLGSGPDHGRASDLGFGASRGRGRRTLVAPDTAPCLDCLAELSDPADRRYGYAFTNCTNCGPRFTIVTGVPYDRCRTTMADFDLCAACSQEYHDASDRRFHAQPVCCQVCGPALRFVDAYGAEVPGDPVTTAAQWLRRGRILAIKGLGGYHLAALADHEQAVSALRERKHREDKPFAVMVPDLAEASRLTHLEPGAERLLTDSRRPIVLLARRPGRHVAPAVAPGNRDLGVMLPYTPVHHLLAERLGRPFVLTSGNLSDEPIAYEDQDARRRLSAVADGFLVHDRRIHARADDSVIRLFRGRQLPIRRSRGYVPAPVRVPWPFPRPVLACGAELKNTFCLAGDGQAFLSQHIGDLENYEALRQFTSGVEHMCRLFGIRPEVVAHDMHPEYMSTKYAMELGGVDLIAVQHHHAHIAACLADNAYSGPVIGVALDGLGYGEDGTLWGGELLVADLASFQRVGHLEAVAMPGGSAAIREPWRMAAAYLDAIYGDVLPDLAVVRRNQDRWAAVVTLARTGTNSPSTSSAGRLFDAVSAICGLRDTVTYEGQAAVALEQRVALDEPGAYPATLVDGPPPVDGPSLVIAGQDLVRCAVEDLVSGTDIGRVAARFHNGLAKVVTRAVLRVGEATGLGTVALSGGVFQNVVLLEQVVRGLEDAGLRVLVHSRVPPNDGGICLGQAVVAAARDRAAAPAASATGAVTPADPAPATR